nr:probable proteasome inhibitor [Ipomoea trifida]
MATDKTVMIMIRAMRPTFRNPYDKVAFVVHASCLASGFVLLATGPSAFCDDPFSSAFAVSEDYSAIRHLELNVQDYVENGGANYDSQYKNFGTLVQKINKEILSKGSSAVKSSRYVLSGLLSLLANMCIETGI